MKYYTSIPFMEDEKLKGHSANRDYSLRYGKNSKASSEFHDDEFSGKAGKKQGLVSRKPL